MSEKAKRAKHREELLELQSMVEPARNDEIARRAIEIAWRYLEKAENQAKMLEIYAARQLVEGKENELPSAQPETCKGCRHFGKWGDEVEYGYPSPCTCCKRRVKDNHER